MSMPEQPGLSADELEQETAVALPERDAMSLVDGGVKLLPMTPVVVSAPTPPIDRLPEDPTASGV
jgi:hypothetical protein